MSKKTINGKKKHHICNVLGWVFITLSALLVIGVKLCITVSPEKLLLPAYIGLGFPFIILFLLITFIVFLLQLKKIKLIVQALLILCILPQCLTYCPIHLTSPEPPKGSIKILSYNVMAFAFGQHSDAHPHPILKYIRESNPDIVCLQEGRLEKNNRGITLEKIKAYLPQYPYTDHRAGQMHGTQFILLSKFPVTEAYTLPIESHFNGAVSYKLEIGHKQLRLISVHLESSGITAREGYEYITLAKEGKAIQLAKKVDLKLKRFFKTRARQVDRLSLELEETKEPYIALVGDFNDTPISYARYHLTRHMQDAYVTSGQGTGYSFMIKKLGIRIDHILLSKNITPYKCTINKTITASDHYPIETYIKLIDEKTKY